MKLLFINRCFWPDAEATGQLLGELTEDLSGDSDVTVVAGPCDSGLIGRRSLLRTEARRRVSIVRTWGTRLPKSNLLGRFINLGTYYVLAAVASLKLGRPDIVVVETDPPLLGLLGALLKIRWGSRFVYYCQDLYPDIAEATGGVRSRALLWLLDRANRIAYAKADAIVVLGQDMRRRVLDKGVAAERIIVIPNWIDCKKVASSGSNPARSRFGDKFVVMYAGNLGLSQQLEIVVAAAEKLRADERILFVLVGDGARKQWLQNEVRRMGLGNLEILPQQPRETIGELLTAADLHLVPLLAGAAGCMVPSKVYGILAAGRPFVAMMEDFADVARLASEHRVGFVTPPGDVDGLVAAIQNALHNPVQLKEMGRRARRLAEEQFERRIVTRRFAQLLEEVARPNGATVNQ